MRYALLASHRDCSNIARRSRVRSLYTSKPITSAVLPYSYATVPPGNLVVISSCWITKDSVATRIEAQVM